MDEKMLSDILVFIGMMAVLGSVMKLTLVLLARRKGGADARSTALLEDIAQRLSRLEQSMDTTALEVERISEAQRFATKMLADRERTTS